MPRSVVIAVTAAPACRLIAGQVRLLAARGWDVHVVVGENVDESVHPTAKVHVLPMRRSPAPGADGLALASWIQLLREIRPAVVVGATPKAGLLSLLAAAATRVPHRVWWVWGLRSEAGGGRAVRLSEHTTARASTSIVAASPSLIDVIPSGRAPKPLVLGFGSVAGVDLRAFAPAASPDSGQTSTSPEALDPTQPRALTVAFLGRLAADKGIPDLARIWPQVSARVPAAQLLLAGAEDSLDPPGQALTILWDQPGVTRLGHVADVASLLRRTDVLCLPSRREGMPAVVLEAAACAVPTVAWDATGSRDAVLDGRTGYLVKVGDDSAMAGRLVDLLTSTDRCHQLGTAARLMVTERFGCDQVELLFADYLETLVGALDPNPKAAVT